MLDPMPSPREWLVFAVYLVLLAIAAYFGLKDFRGNLPIVVVSLGLGMCCWFINDRLAKRGRQ